MREGSLDKGDGRTGGDKDGEFPWESGMVHGEGWCWFVRED